MEVKAFNPQSPYVKRNGEYAVARKRAINVSLQTWALRTHIPFIHGYLLSSDLHKKIISPCTPKEKV